MDNAIYVKISLNAMIRQLPRLIATDIIINFYLHNNSNGMAKKKVGW